MRYNVGHKLFRIIHHNICYNAAVAKCHEYIVGIKHLIPWDWVSLGLDLTEFQSRLRSSVCWTIVKIRSRNEKKINCRPIQGGPKLDCYHCFWELITLRRLIAGVQSTEVCNASKRLKHVKQLSVKKYMQVNIIKDLDFICVISMSLTGFICINGNHFCCPSGRRVIGITLPFTLVLNDWTDHLLVLTMCPKA